MQSFETYPYSISYKMIRYYRRLARRNSTFDVSTLVALVKESRGAALVVALMIMTILSLLTVSSLEILTVNVQIAGNHIHDLQVLYITEAGIEDAIDRLRSDPKWDKGLTKVEFPAGSGNTYTVTIDNSESSSIAITSTGTALDFQRSLEVMVAVTGSPPNCSARIESWKEIPVP